MILTFQILRVILIICMVVYYLVAILEIWHGHPKYLRYLTFTAIFYFGFYWIKRGEDWWNGKVDSNSI